MKRIRARCSALLFAAVGVASCGGGSEDSRIVAKGPGGGVLMHVGDKGELVEQVVKPAGTQTFFGPPGPPGGPGDREILSYDGKLLVMRYADPVEARRYGTMVYWRCGK